jgi:hypothetical protein
MAGWAGGPGIIAIGVCSLWWHITHHARQNETYLPNLVDWYDWYECLHNIAYVPTYLPTYKPVVKKPVPLFFHRE